MKQRRIATILGDGSLHLEGDDLTRYAGKQVSIEFEMPNNPSREPESGTQALSKEARDFLQWSKQGIALQAGDDPEALGHARLAEERIGERLS